MKIFKKQRPEEIYAMATIGVSFNPVFQLAVNPGETQKGDPYFKVYNAKNWRSANKVARIRFDSSHYVKPHRGKDIWVLNSAERKSLQKFLSAPQEDHPDISNWDYTKYMWNRECGLMVLENRQVYKTPMQAYFDGYFDTEENLADPDYIPSYLSMLDYTEIDG